MPLSPLLPLVCADQDGLWLNMCGENGAWQDQLWEGYVTMGLSSVTEEGKQGIWPESLGGRKAAKIPIIRTKHCYT